MAKTKVRISESDLGKLDHVAAIYDVKVLEAARYNTSTGAVMLVVQLGFKNPDSLFYMGKDFGTLEINVQPETQVGGIPEVQGASFSIPDKTAIPVKPVQKVKQKTKR